MSFIRPDWLATPLTKELNELPGAPGPEGNLSPGGVFAIDPPGFLSEVKRDVRSSSAATAADAPVSLVVLKKFLISVT